jgi:hypothetical protein
MEGYCSTGQSPQRAVVPVEEEEEEEEEAEDEEEEEEEEEEEDGRMNSEGSNLVIECVKLRTDFHYCGMKQRG